MRRTLLLPLLALALAGCRNDMHNQAKTKPLRESPFFADHSSARPLPEGVVARGFLRADAAIYRGVAEDGKFVLDIPVPVTRPLLLRGRERFDIFCSPCHGRTGDGQGMIVQRGFKSPSTFHVDRLRNERAGYFFDVMTNGFGQMSSYASQITPEDRWAIVAWMKTLQASQNMPKEFLAKDDEGKLEAAAAGGGTASPAQKSFLEGESGAAAAHPAPGAAPATSAPYSPSKKSSSEGSEAR
ncbi:MAG TPA: cytochrome c [Thermoanaerobaculia bacterium]|nr:cytochrome c [Thermoanaerobaculia bacterium]